MHATAITTTAPKVAAILSPDQEANRLAALEQLDLLETPREESFERIVRLIRNIFNVPIALVSLIDGHRQWHKACIGVTDREAERKHTFCQYPVATGKSLVVTDALVDPIFSQNPHVLAEGGLRFYAGVPLTTHSGHAIGTVCAVGLQPREFSSVDLQILTDLSAVTMHEIELRHQAETDALTGLLSRRAFKDQGSGAIALARRHAHSLTCAAIDIDHFKVVNDTYGHPMGDKVLVQIAAACKQELRQTDILGRTGGEEFAVLLPHTSAAQALEVAEKLRKAIRRRRIQCGNVTLRVTASIGIASLEAEDLDSLLSRADRALYAAKQQGRDRCVNLHPLAGAPPRRRVLKGGRILFNNRCSTIDCTVRSLNEQGAGIDVWNAYDVPDKFMLLLLGQEVERTCRVISRSEKHLEVDFR